MSFTTLLEKPPPKEKRKSGSIKPHATHQYLVLEKLELKICDN
jgi:hypothetical protein